MSPRSCSNTFSSFVSLHIFAAAGLIYSTTDEADPLEPTVTTFDTSPMYVRLRHMRLHHHWLQFTRTIQGNIREKARDFGNGTLCSISCGNVSTAQDLYSAGLCFYIAGPLEIPLTHLSIKNLNMDTWVILQ